VEIGSRLWTLNQSALLALLLLFSCDPFQEDAIPFQNQITVNESATTYFIAPGSTAVIDMRLLVNSSTIMTNMKIADSTKLGKLVQLDELLLQYKPSASFTQGKDQFKVAFYHNDRVMKATTITIHAALRVNDLPCGLYAVTDSVSTRPGEPVLIKYLENDRLCGIESTTIQTVIFKEPAHGVVVLKGDSIQYVPNENFLQDDQLIYRLSANQKLSTGKDTLVVSYGMVIINGKEPCTFSVPEFYVLDLTDEIEDPISTGECAGYEIKAFELVTTNCEWHSGAYLGMTQTRNSGDVCAGLDGRFAYYIDTDKPAVNDTAQLKLMVNEYLFELTIYIKRQKDNSKWSTKSISGAAISKIFFLSETTGYAGGPSGIYKTKDGGNNWTRQTNLPIISGSNGTTIYDMFFLDSNIGFVGYSGCYDNYECKGSLMSTKDGGITWQEQDFEHAVTSVVFTSTQVGYVATSSSPGDFSNNRIYRTTNGGLTWQQVVNDKIYLGGFDIAFVSESQGFASLFGKIFKTDDSGLSWILATENKVGEREYPIGSITKAGTGVCAIFYYTDGNNFTTSTIRRSEDGVSWNDVAIGVSTFPLAFSPSGNLGLGPGYPTEIIKSTDQGKTWNEWDFDKQVFGGLSISEASIPSEKVVYFLCNGGEIIKYDDR